MVESEERELIALFESAVKTGRENLGDADQSRQRLAAAMESLQFHATQSKRASAEGSPSGVAVAAAASLAISAVWIFWLATHPRATPVNPHGVLAQAVAQELRSRIGRSGISIAHVQVKRNGRTLVWPVYRDLAGRRKPRFKPAGDESLEKELRSAGVDRQDPLSAASFESWHDRQQSIEDRLATAGGFTTVTATPARNSASMILSESLTLRASDLHPVARSINLVNNETIELAELDESTLNWRDVPREWFDSPPEVISLPATRLAGSVPRVPLLSQSQIDLAELQARLVLSKQGADATEQVEVRRTPQGVIVSGLVSSQDRKQSLKAQLNSLPHVTTQVSTAEELDQAGTLAPGASPITIRSVQSSSEPSPLLLLWKSQGRPVDQLSPITNQLNQSALRIRQQAHALRDLDQSSVAQAATNSEAKPVLADLRRDHESKLADAIRAEKATLSGLIAGSARPVTSGTSSRHQLLDELDQDAARLLDASHALTAGGVEPSEDADRLLRQLDELLFRVQGSSDRLASIPD